MFLNPLLYNLLLFNFAQDFNIRSRLSSLEGATLKSTTSTVATGVKMPLKE